MFSIVNGKGKREINIFFVDLREDPEFLKIFKDKNIHIKKVYTHKDTLHDKFEYYAVKFRHRDWPSIMKDVDQALAELYKRMAIFGLYKEYKEEFYNLYSKEICGDEDAFVIDTDDKGSIKGYWCIDFDNRFKEISNPYNMIFKEKSIPFEGTPYKLIGADASSCSEEEFRNCMIDHMFELAYKGIEAMYIYSVCFNTLLDKLGIK